MSAPLQPQQLQQNEVHHHQHHQPQQPPIITTIDFMDLINSGFSTLYNHNKDLDDAAVGHMRLKYDIFLNCLNAKEWKAVKNQCGEAVFVHPEYVPKFVEYGDRDTAATDDDGFDFENSIEGVAFVQPFNFGHEKSGKTLDHYNVLYAREVLGTEIGRRLIQHHLPASASSLTTTPMEVDQVQVDNRKKLENDTFNHIMGSLKGLSIGGGTNLRQIDDALSVSKSVGERLELLRNRHLEMEKRKRRLDLVPQNKLVADDTHEKKQRTDNNTDDISEVANESEDVSFDNDDGSISISSDQSGSIADPMVLDSSQSEKYTLEFGNTNDSSPDTSFSISSTTSTSQKLVNAGLSHSDNNDTTFASAEVSFDIDSDTQMQVIEPTEDQDNDVQPSPWNGVSAVGSSVNTQPTPRPSSSSTILAPTAHEPIMLEPITPDPNTMPKEEKHAILQELVSFGITEDQTKSLNQIDAGCIDGYEAVAYSMIKDGMDLLVERVSGGINIESIPICEREQPNQCLSAGKLPPLGMILTRGSDNTHNTTTSQFVHGLTALLVSVACKVLPEDTEVLKHIVAGLELDRRKTEGSDADHNLCEILRSVDKERQVILIMEESLRLGLFDEVVEKLLIKYRGIHSNLKVLIVKEAGLHPVHMASINYKYHLEGQNITAECGGSKNPRDTSIEISSDDRKKQSDIDAEASVLMSDLIRRRDDNQPLPSQLVNGINNGEDFNSETITLVEDIFWDLRCLMSEGDLSEATVEEMFKPLLGKEIDGIKKMPLLLHRCSTKASHEATEKVSNVPVQQLSKNLVIGKKNGVVTNDSSLFITQAIRTRQIAGCNTDGHDDILRICAMILERRANALISTTVVRAGIDELVLMVLKILCKMAGIPWLLSEEAGRELDDLIRAVQERQERMEARLKTRNSARENLADQLSPFDRAFNQAMARIGGRHISKDKHLFQDVLIEVIKKRSRGRILFREKTRDFWKQAKEDPSKLKDDDAIHLVNSYCFKRMCCSTLKSSHLSILTDVHSWAMNQPPISSPDEAKTIIQTVMSKRTVLESEQRKERMEERRRLRVEKYHQQIAECDKQIQEREAKGLAKCTDAAAYDWYHLLSKYIEDTRAEKTKNMTEEKKSAWVWDGNVPTSYLTPCGQALGRWVNNQRTAKSNGTLDSDREERLVSMGLRLLTVSASGDWEQSLQLLEQYAQEQTTDDIPWDGEVPTTYKTACGKAIGRWVGRQRTQFNNGKLAKERQGALENVGLRLAKKKRYKTA